VLAIVAIVVVVVVGTLVATQWTPAANQSEGVTISSSGVPELAADTFRDIGLVLTNNHVVEHATHIQVVLFPAPEASPAETRRFDAEVLGRDPFTDSALLQVKGVSDLPAAPFGNSDEMRPGDWVMAIGSPFALSHTVTIGVISATARPFPLEGRPQRVHHGRGLKAGLPGSTLVTMPRLDR
jgi:serine protease Do